VDEAKNILGGELQSCCASPMTGFYRDGHCNTGPEDLGAHVICAEVTEEFLEFSRATGNDLSSPVPQMSFPGLVPGDRWCICAARWGEAVEAGVAPPVVLAASHERALEIISLDDLKRHALDLAS